MSLPREPSGSNKAEAIRVVTTDGEKLFNSDQKISGLGDVTKVGTPLDDQVAVWTGDGTIEGTANFSFTSTALTALNYIFNADQTVGAGQDNFVLTYDNATGEIGLEAAATGGAPEGTAVLSTGEVGGTKYLREDGDGTSSWQSVPGGGDVTKVGTPVNDQIGVWTGDGTIEGATTLTYNTTTFTASSQFTKLGDSNGISIRATVANQQAIMHGGLGNSGDADIILYGENKTSFAGDFKIRSQQADVIDWDESAGETTFKTASGGSKGTALLLNNVQAAIPTNLHLPTETTTNLADITHAINTSAAKVEGSIIFNTTSNQPVYAVGNADGDVWVDATGATAHTPV